MQKIKKNLYLLSILFAGLRITCTSFAQTIPEDKAWPREIKTKKALVVVYQPQVETLTDIRLDARAAIAVIPRGESKPLYGAAWFTSRIATDRDARMVSLREIKVKSIKFPNVNEQEKQGLVNLLEREIPKWTISLSLDRLITSLNYHPEDNIRGRFNDKPPEIIFSQEPSILILIDGAPIYKDLIDGPGYYEVINTPFFLVSDAAKKNYFLHGGDTWYTAHELTGNWKVSQNVPYVLTNIVKKAEKEKSQDEKPVVSGPVQVFLRTHPAELIQSKGKPEFSPVENTKLIYMTNTEDDILMDIDTQQYYVLISGRWYHASSLTGNSWSFVPQAQLPDDFADIPTDSDIANVRANISGTPEAREAILDNTIPQTAEIDRQKATVEVSYDGNPEFEKIKGTDMEYAVNTDKSVLKINNRYYCCNDAIWFVANGAYGPWSVCVDVPETVQDIPPQYPVYNVKYVHIYHYTPEVVYVGYTPAYLGSYVYHGTVIYGTGYYYHPWYRYHYYPRPVTYGFGVHYSPFTGWGFSYGVRYGWFHVGYGYHPATYYRGGWWGPGGYSPGYRYGYGIGFHYGYSAGSRSGARAAYRESNRRSYYSNRTENIYKNGVSGVKSTGTGTGSRRGNTTNRNTVSTNKQVKRSSKGVSRQNNVYSDQNGNVYRHTNNGWQKRDNGRWTNSGNLKTDYNSRNRGTRRTQNYHKIVRPPDTRRKTKTTIRSPASSGKSKSRTPVQKGNSRRK